MDKYDLKYLLNSSKSYFKSKFNNSDYLREENVTRKFAFHSVVAKKDIQKGEKLSLKNLTTKRPGTGKYLAFNIDKLINKKTKKKILKNTQLKKSHVN